MTVTGLASTATSPQPSKPPQSGAHARGGEAAARLSIIIPLTLLLIAFALFR